MVSIVQRNNRYNVVYLYDDEATGKRKQKWESFKTIISMVDANLQRERISPSEKAFAYKMKYDVLKRKAGRRKCSQVDYLTGKRVWRL